MEAQGGNASVIVGTQWGLTASVLTYSMLRGQDFKVLPFAARKTQGYAKIGVAFLGFYMLGHGLVMGKFGDRRQFNHLYMNKSGCLNGTVAWDKEE